MYIAYRRFLRQVILWLLFFLPLARRQKVERWLRGREEARKLGLADSVVVSYGKSGRTWLRVMLSRFFQVKHGLSERHLIGFDNLHRKNPAIPKIFFTHDNYLKDYTKNAGSKVDYAGAKVVLLVRHPADVAVSQHFQWKFRMRKAKKALNDYPDEDAELSVFDFVMQEGAGLPKILDFMNLWARAREAARLQALLIVRYEDMRARPQETLGRILEFIGTPGEPAQLAEAVDFASVENMRAMEQKKTFWLSGSRMKPKDRSNPQSFKVRRAKVGGYRDYFTDEEVARIDEMIATRLDPSFGYASAEPASGAAAAEDARRAGQA
ncbi:MAG: sulfotransferase domain-containing protein [Kiloniellales bacterium]|nr:sulfotransferase domain-containing protein [Kiloniellales bacterium]